MENSPRQRRSSLSSRQPTITPTNFQNHQAKSHKINAKKDVKGLKPSPVVALHESAKCIEAASYMAAKRQDAVLITNTEGHLVGIVTDKDMTYKLVAAMLNPTTTAVSEIMTRNPISVTSHDLATDALHKMVSGHFRHLPVLDDESGDEGVVGMLDITKCLYSALQKLEKINSNNKRAIEAIDQVRHLSNVDRYVEYLRDQLGSPTITGILDRRPSSTPVVGLSATVIEAAKIMMEANETAVLVLDQEDENEHIYSGSIAGIFTSKDIVLRVLAAGFDPTATTVVRVMTPHPDVARPDTTVLEALRKMHAGRYLHLPIVDENGLLAGLVDVLKLTYSTLEQLNTMVPTTADSQPEEEGGGPMWNRFWDSALLNSTNSELSTNSKKYLPALSDGGSVAPDDSASMFQVNNKGMVGYPASRKSPLGSPSSMNSTSMIRNNSALMLQGGESFVYKIKDEGRTYRFMASSTHLDTLLDILHEKIFSRKSNYTKRKEVGYLDDEGDIVQLQSDRDLEDAVIMARAAGWKKLELVLTKRKKEKKADSTSKDKNESSVVGSIVEHMLNRQDSNADIFVGGTILLIAAFWLGRAWKDSF